ncbi:hypothetical protein ACSSV5_001690 [Psychroflexus sp. MBR-150]|jgi:hypothetical protein
MSIERSMSDDTSQLDEISPHSSFEMTKFAYKKMQSSELQFATNRTHVNLYQFERIILFKTVETLRIVHFP